MLESGQLINQRYQLQKQLGSNPIRVTWLATDLETQEVVVVKLLCFGGNVQWDEVKLFEREAEILKQLKHQRIPKYRDYFSIDDRTLWFGLVQEYIPGSNLKDLLTQGKRFSEDEIKDLATQILEILRYLHGLNPPVYHRDIKPSNLIMGEDHHIYLVDFGAVQDKAIKTGATFTVVGTYGYAPMEQFSGKTVPASDLYALGVTLIHLLTGIPPSELPIRDFKIQFRHLVTFESYLLTWLEKITEPATEKRFQTAVEALGYLEQTKDSVKLSNYHKNELFDFGQNSRGKIINTHLELTINLKGFTLYDFIKLLFKIENIPGFAVLIFCLLCIIAGHAVSFLLSGMGVFLPMILTPIISQIFPEQQIKINSEYLVINNYLFKHQIKHIKICLNQILDISVKYQIIDRRSQPALQETSKEIPECLVITAKKSTKKLSREKYYFGKGLSEMELIKLEQLISQWINHAKATAKK